MGNTTDLLGEIAAARGNLLTAASALTALTAATNAFVYVAEKIEVRFKELQEKETCLKAMEQQAALRNEALDGRETQLKESGIKIAQREEKSMRWAETEKRMALNAAKLPTLIHLNVGK
jgi:hypothetical protein